MSDDVELIEVVEGVHRYADGLVNWYLLEEAGELTLVGRVAGLGSVPSFASWTVGLLPSS